MIDLLGVHHIAIICSDYSRSKKFYTEILGLAVIQETYRPERSSYKLDLAIGDHYIIELFSFPNPPKRTTNPEAAGLRHLALSVANVEACRTLLMEKGINAEAIRKDEFTGKHFFFFTDPDDLPIELYEL